MHPNEDIKRSEKIKISILRKVLKDLKKKNKISKKIY